MILKGDCIEVMKAVKPNSVDAIVTDPPYGLEFMGKEWDRLITKRDGFDDFGQNTESGRHGGRSNPYIQSRIDKYQAGLQAQLWHTQWLTEAYRVLKPGGSMLVMGGTRTFHRLACAIEDTGFIIKDTLMWLYGSGFPKAQEASVLVDSKILGISTKKVNEKRNKLKVADDRNKNTRKDKLSWGGTYGMGIRYETFPLTPEGEHWDGFKVGGIKPAYEPIIWAVKPPEGSYIDNVLKWGVGAVNVDECRVGIDCIEKGRGNRDVRETGIYGRYEGQDIKHFNYGRFPANVILDEEAGRLLDEQSGIRKSPAPYIQKSKVPGDVPIAPEAYHDRLSTHHGDSGGASRFFYCAKASRTERNLGLDKMPTKLRDFSTMGTQKDEAIRKRGRNPENQNIPESNIHPTVKPIALFEWLVKLVTREGQIVLDPFIGSGTTAIACHKTNRKCVGIEKEGEYLEIAKRRIKHWEGQPKQMEMQV